MSNLSINQMDNNKNNNNDDDQLFFTTEPKLSIIECSNNHEDHELLNHKSFNNNDGDNNNNDDKIKMNDKIDDNNNIDDREKSEQQQQQPWTMKLIEINSNFDKNSKIIINNNNNNNYNDEKINNKQQEQQINNNNNDDNNDKNKLIYESNEHTNKSFLIFYELMKKKQVCDVIIKIDDKKFYVHRIILCATIPYFYGMFTNDLIERNKYEIEIKNNEINIMPTITSDSFELIIDYIYTGKLIINSTNVQSLLISSSYLGLQNIQNACSDFLINNLQIQNVIKVKTFATLLNCQKLIDSTKYFILNNFEYISKIDDFLNLESIDLLDIISNDELNVSNEKIVFDAIIRWLKYDEELRKCYLPNLFEKIRLPLLSPEYLCDIVMGQKLIRESLRCRDLIDEAKDYHLLPSRRNLLSNERTKPRSGHQVQGLIYAVGGLTKSGDSLSTVEVYDPKIKRWRMAEAMSMMRSRVGVAVMERKLYAIGGYNGFDRLNTVEVYNSKSKQWKRVKSMQHRRSAVGAASLNDELYVCGGYDGSVSLNIVEKYSSTKNEWMEITPMNIKRSAAGVVSLNGYIYALGGHDGLMIFSSVERYDPYTQKWEFVESMLSRRCRLGCCCLNGKIYVCGGYDGCTFLQTAEVFDPQTGKWSPISKMRVTRSRVALVANHNNLYAIGGYDGVTNLSSVEIYDVEKNSWEMISSMVAHEGGVGVGVIPDNY